MSTLPTCEFTFSCSITDCCTIDQILEIHLLFITEPEFLFSDFVATQIQLFLEIPALKSQGALNWKNYQMKSKD